MEPEFFRFRFSTHFNRLAYLGMWSADMISNSTTKKIYLLYCTVWHFILLTAMTLQMIDLCLVIGNARKVTFNFCTSLIVIGYTIKMIMLWGRKDHLNELRVNLWQDSLTMKSDEDVALQDDAYSQLIFIRNWFYGACICILPLMVVSCYFSYKWGPRELPFAAFMPMSDPLNDFIYLPALIFEAICAFYVISVAIEAELCSFSVCLQVDAYYSILIKNLNKLDEIFADQDDNDEGGSVGKKLLKMYTEKIDFRRSVNMYLKKEGANKLIKSCIIRHIQIIEYIERIEFVYSRCLFLHSFAASLLLIMNGIEFSLYMHEISIRLCFQLAFITMILVDLLFICYFVSKLSAQSESLANAAYSTLWYKMDADLRRKLGIMIMRSRKPPRITGGKFFLMDLQAFLQMLSNIYSWLMLMRRVIATK